MKWAEFRKFALAHTNCECQRCGERKRQLHVHHLNYDRLGCERLSDVEVVCEICHMPADDERKRRSAQRAQANQWENAYDTYMAKKYGDGFYDDDESRQEFQEWLEDQY
jgi:hypothetical protein